MSDERKPDYQRIRELELELGLDTEAQQAAESIVGRAFGRPRPKLVPFTEELEGPDGDTVTVRGWKEVGT